jgi:hypothetical protein
VRSAKTGQLNLKPARDLLRLPPALVLLPELDTDPAVPARPPFDGRFLVVLRPRARMIELQPQRPADQAIEMHRTRARECPIPGHETPDTGEPAFRCDPLAKAQADAGKLTL